MRGPVRIQRKRTRGWKMPPNTVYVGRPSRFGNMFTGPNAAADFRAHLACQSSFYCGPVDLVAFEEIRTHLRGKNLACWCPLADQHGNYVPCHADVLISIANDIPIETVINENLRRAKGEAAQ